MSILDSLLLLALLCLLQPSPLCATSIYYVKPTQPHNATCPSDHPCLTLDEYAVSSDKYFIFNTIFLFLSGNHELSSSFNVCGIHNLTLKPYTAWGSVVVFGRISHPFILIAMRYEAVSSIVISNLIIKSISLEFNISSNVSLNKLLLTSDSSVAELLLSCSNYNCAAINSTRSTITLAECKCLGLQQVCILSKSSDIIIKNHFTFVQSINTASALSLFGTSTLVLEGDAILSSNVVDTQCKYPVDYDSKTAISGRENSTIILGGTIVFNGFCAPNGASINLRENCHAVISGNASFSQNIAHFGGAIAVENGSVLVINGTVTFTDNTAAKGGAIYLSPRGRVHLDGEILFINNTSNLTGGAVHGEGIVNIQGVVTFIGNGASQSGGAISSVGGYTLSDSQRYLHDLFGALNITGKATFTENRVSELGGAIFLSETTSIHIKGDVTFTNNTARMGGAICVTGLSSISTQDNIIFIGNSAFNGGAIAVLGYHFFFILPKPNISHITFINNTACQYGGALFLSSENEFNLVLNYIPSRISIAFNFTNNRASDGGDAMYGVHFSNFDEESQLLYFSPSFAEDPSVISSDPTGLCFCKESFDCSLPSPSYAVYPGESFEVSIAVVGELQGLVKSTVQASIYNCVPADIFVALGNLQHVQTSSSRKCTTFQYSIFTNNTRNFVCGIKFMTGGNFLNNLTIHVQSCPLGFKLNGKTRLCDCAQQLEATGAVNCNISGTLIQRQDTTWIGVLKSTNHTSLVFSTTCPFSYCVKGNTSINISLYPLMQDAQCGDFHSGILCGSCRMNYSLALGSNRCLPGCTNYSLSLIIAFAAAGIVLVFFIKILNLTVSQGTLNGIIFYANIIGAHPTLFFPNGDSLTSTFLNIFIAWLNLDLGIETCFFDGMDNYVKALLQLVFPVYIWTIALFIIVLSHYSIRASRLLGNNSVPVLATLVLLSYTKLLRAVISPLSIAYYQFLNGTKMSVWERDGNVPYLAGKHIPLFALAVGVLLFLLFPFTLVMTSIQWLNRGTHYRVLCWVIKFKPFFDAFTGPLKHKHRYWIGILLITRCALLLVFFTYTVNGDSTALFAISVAVIILATFHSKYRISYLTILEHSYVLNLGLLSIVTGFLKLSSAFSDKQEVVITLSVGIAFLQFLCTVIYHAYTQLREPVKACVERIRANWRTHEVDDGNDSDSERDSVGEQHPLIPPTRTEIHLPLPEQEMQLPLSESESGNDSNFREPLLAYLSDD